MTAFDSARHAVVGASASLQEDLKDLGVHVIVVHTDSIRPEKLFEPVRSSGKPNERQTAAADGLPNGALPEYAVRTMFDALLVPNPKPVYAFEKPSRFNGYGLSGSLLKPERRFGYENIWIATGALTGVRRTCLSRGCSSGDTG